MANLAKTQSFNHWFLVGILLALAGLFLACSPLMGLLHGPGPVILGLLVLVAGGVMAVWQWLADHMDLPLF